MELEVIIYLLANAFRIYAVSRFVKSFFGDSNSKQKLLILLFVLYFTINSLFFLMVPNPIVNLISNIVPLFFITMFFESKIMMKIVVSVLIYAVNMFSDGVIFAVSKALGINTIVISSGLITALMVFAIEMLWEHYKRFKYMEVVQTSYLFALFFVPLCSIVIGVLTIQQANLRTVVLSAVLLIINALIFYLFDSLVRLYNYRYEKIMLEQQNKAYINQIKQVYDSQNALRYYRHDMKNHLFKIRDMVEKREYKQLDEYISYAASYMKIDKKVIDSGNSEIDCLLNYKLRNIEEMNIKLETKFVLPYELFINVFDINVVLGNLIDNALEALKQCDERELIIHLTYSKGVMFIAIKNSFIGNIKNDSNNNKIFTTKQDLKNHGLGLQSVRYTIDKYCGTMEIETTDKMFVVKALMYNK